MLVVRLYHAEDHEIDAELHEKNEVEEQVNEHPVDEQTLALVVHALQNDNTKHIEQTEDVLGELVDGRVDEIGHIADETFPHIFHNCPFLAHESSALRPAIILVDEIHVVGDFNELIRHAIAILVLIAFILQVQLILNLLDCLLTFLLECVLLIRDQEQIKLIEFKLFLILQMFLNVFSVNILELFRTNIFFVLLLSTVFQHLSLPQVHCLAISL